jgi:catechol 2,3-dioxygenase-like lactoylglutathione lyase family enzyme
MASRFTELAIDCHRPDELATFWCAVLGYEVIERKDDYVEIASWHPSAEAVRAQVSPPTLVFARVPESKTVKNRVHIDVSPIDRGRDEEVERLLALGARHVDIGQGEQSWVVLADPEGNEFCVLRSLQPDQNKDEAM